MKESKVIWLKQVECPLCYEEFTTENIWMNKVSVIEEYPDLGKKYVGINPLFYSVWVCPNCYYADLRGDEFEKTGKINDEKFEEDYSLLEMIAEKEDFRNPRTFGLAIKSYKLAIFVAKHKQSSLARIGTFNLRLAWLYRSIKKTELERRYLEYALDNYVKAFTTESEPDFGKLGAGGTHYLLGVLYQQIGDLKSALRFFQKVVNDKKMSTEPKYIKLARLQWETLRDKAPSAVDEINEEEAKEKETNE